MKASYESQYVSKNGNTTFVYRVSGSKEELAAYKKAKGEYHTTAEDGTPLFFTTRFVGDNADLIITSTGNVVADMSKFRKAESMVEQIGGKLGDALAKELARELLGGSNAGNIDA